MARLETFTFRVDDEERKMITRLSKRLQRSQSDSVRLLIREAYQQLDTAVATQFQCGGESDERIE